MTALFDNLLNCNQTVIFKRHQAYYKKTKDGIIASSNIQY